MSWLTDSIPEEEMKYEHAKEYEDVMNYYKINDGIYTDRSGQNLLNTLDICRAQVKPTVVNKAIGMSKVVLTIIFMVICTWMLWISYNTLVQAIRTYIL
jgi:hypothetical protein